MWLALALMSVAHGTVAGQCLFNFHYSKNPEAQMNISEMASFTGYPSEEYGVVTEGGYILQLNRIPYGRGNVGSQDTSMFAYKAGWEAQVLLMLSAKPLQQKPDEMQNIGPRPVAFLQHGLFGEGSIQVTSLANNSLGFILADAGYDVWIGNSRGNTWSKRHLVLSPKLEEFRAFSFGEMAKYDRPAIINFIEQKTGQMQLYYVSHSRGTAIAFIVFSTMPQLAQKIKMYFALAPVATVIFVQSPFKKLTFFSDYGLKGVQSGALRAYDGGSMYNSLRYRQDVKVPTAIWSGGVDCLADPWDVALLLPQARNPVHHKVIPQWNHLDFLLGLDAAEVLYQEIVNMMKRHP